MLRKISLFVIAVSLLFTFSSNVIAQENAPKLAVVNLKNISEGYKKKIDADDYFRTKYENVSVKLRELRKEVEKIEKKIAESPLRKDSIEFIKMTHELQKAKLNLKQTYEIEENILKKEKQKYVDMITEEIEKEIKKFASENKYDFVFRGNYDGLMNSTNVICSSKRVDISQAVTDRLNEKYEKSGKQKEWEK